VFVDKGAGTIHGMAFGGHQIEQDRHCTAARGGVEIGNGIDADQPHRVPVWVMSPALPRFERFMDPKRGGVVECH